MKLPPVYLIAGAAVGAALLYVWAKGAKGTGAALVGGAISVADGAVSEVVNTVGEAVGIPRTNPSKCEKAKAEGRTWDASFDCPALDFLKYWWER
jgi:hypothetical protein